MNIVVVTQIDIFRLFYKVKRYTVREGRASLTESSMRNRWKLTGQRFDSDTVIYPEHLDIEVKSHSTAGVLTRMTDAAVQLLFKESQISLNSIAEDYGRGHLGAVLYDKVSERLKNEHSTLYKRKIERSDKSRTIKLRYDK